MKFDDKTDSNLLKPVKSTKLLTRTKETIEFNEYEDPFKTKKLKYDDLWTKVKDKIFDTERPILKNFGRHINMTMNKTENYLTKLDLIDTHP